ncbi:MAG: methionine ABC transporter permease [Candidatus Faecousia sp.]|nr:ABC transporter permease [Bacillota bacterium]MDY4755698.1 methionine ABC transporter permease [Candidatus Faecousia sp.]MDY6159710.1 methionine ABC transporter permease [Candidatus Faecousia sp.]
MFDLFSDPVKVAKQLDIIVNEFGFATWETLYSLVLEVAFAYLIGLPLGVLLVTGEKEGIKPLPKPIMTVLNVVINLLRSVPFLILMIITLPLSKIIVGTKVGTMATIPPMVIAAFPMVARMVESSLREVDHGVIEAAQSMGASAWQIATKVMLPEALPSLISGCTISVGTILGYGAMAGIIGGGGLGKIAINYGYYNFKFLVMWAAVIGLILLVQIFQTFGTWLGIKCDKRLRNRS